MNNLHNKLTVTLSKAVLAAMILVSSPSHAVVINSYFGWNLCCDASVPAPLEITSITYVGGSGITTTSVPAFPSPFGVGMPDLPTFVASPTYTTSGDGESTRTIGASMPIDWDLVPYAYPSISIRSFTVFDGSGTSTANLSAPYTVGLIPLGADTELSSSLGIFQGDIYDGLAGAAGNPLAVATFTAGPLTSVVANVSFAAAQAPTVPVPPAVWLFGSAISLLGWMRRKAS